MFDPVEKLKDYVRHPSISADSNYKAGMAGARDFVAGLLASIGFAVEVVPTPLHPIVLARREGPAHWPHVMIYGHYDVQPVDDPHKRWQSPAFDPQIRGGRMYGRGTADNKGPLMAHIAAVGRLLERRPDLPLRITFLIEGEEEIGSPSFHDFLMAHRDRLKADFVFLSDTGIPSEQQVVITCGLRGLVLFDVEITGPKSDLHSGLHGGVLRNPIQAVAELCATLHTADGRVNVPGFYDDVLKVEEWEREELKKMNGNVDQYREFLDIPAFYTPPGYTPFEALRFLPTLEFNGISGGYQGEGTKTVIPSKASVKISCRLVPNQNPAKIRELLYKTVRERVPAGVTARIIDHHQGVPYVVVPPDRPNTPKDQSPVLARAFRAADAAVADIFGKPPLYLREGGSIPIIGDIKRILGLDSLMLGLFLPEDNLHAPNESFHLGVLEKGIRASERILESLAGS